MFFTYRAKFICYKINGIWFRLNHSQWASLRGIKRGTISLRYREGYPVKQILGYESLKRFPYGSKSERTRSRKKLKNNQPLLNKFLLGK